MIRSFDYSRRMETLPAIAAFSALAHSHRLKVFQILIKASPDGISAGEIASRLGIPSSSLSFHLGLLERAGLIKSKRDQRRIVYSADINGTRSVISFLVKDCCDGHPEFCNITASNDVTHTKL